MKEIDNCTNLVQQLIETAERTLARRGFLLTGHALLHLIKFIVDGIYKYSLFEAKFRSAAHDVYNPYCFYLNSNLSKYLISIICRLSALVNALRGGCVSRGASPFSDFHFIAASQFTHYPVIQTVQRNGKSSLVPQLDGRLIPSGLIIIKRL